MIPVEDDEPDSLPEEAGFPGEDELEDLVVDADDQDVEDLEGGEDDEEEAEEAEDGEEAEGEGAPQKAKPKAKAKGDEEEEVAHPDTPVPSRSVMRKALDWAFDGEEDVDDALLDKFTEHALALLEKNRVMNLTAILDPKELAAKHYLDSWRVTRLVPLMARRVLDLGTGGGFPGIPVALAEPNLSMTLCDRTKKKVDWLVEICEKLGAKNCHPVWGPAEEHLTRERVDIVLVRAVSSVRENVRTLRKVRHALQDMVMLKGASWSREVRAAEREAERLGFKLDTVWEHELPGEMGKRAILVYRAPGGAGN